MNIFTLTFPVSYMMLLFGLIIGAGIAIIFFGSVSFMFAGILILMGVVRILPLLELIHKIILILFPETIERMSKNIGKSFPVVQTESLKKGIYIFHPHGMFSLAHFFHVGSGLTKWPQRPIRGTAIYYLWSMPFGRELMDSFGSRFVASTYDAMVNVLEGGESLSVSLGGVREILHTEKGIMKLSISKKRGVFRMALATGTPLFPVLTYGENELFEIMHHSYLDRLQEMALPYGIVFPIPTVNSCINWFSLLNAPLKNPVETVIGNAIEVEKVEEPSEKQIIELREKYIQELRTLYRNTRPSWYENELIII